MDRINLTIDVRANNVGPRRVDAHGPSLQRLGPGDPVREVVLVADAQGLVSPIARQFGVSRQLGARRGEAERIAHAEGVTFGLRGCERIVGVFDGARMPPFARIHPCEVRMRQHPRLDTVFERMARMSIRVVELQRLLQ